MYVDKKMIIIVNLDKKAIIVNKLNSEVDQGIIIGLTANNII